MQLLAKYSQRTATDFSGLVEFIAARKRGATLHGQRKCRQAECPQFYHDLRNSAFEDGYNCKASLEISREKFLCAILSHVIPSHVTPP